MRRSTCSLRAEGATTLGPPRRVDAYTAQMGRVYVRRDGAWKMAFHQQTPLD
jgi:hypothetical protein